MRYRGLAKERHGREQHQRHAYEPEQKTAGAFRIAGARGGPECQYERRADPRRKQRDLSPQSLGEMPECGCIEGRPRCGPPRLERKRDPLVLLVPDQDRRENGEGKRGPQIRIGVPKPMPVARREGQKPE